MQPCDVWSSAAAVNEGDGLGDGHPVPIEQCLQYDSGAANMQAWWQ
jgi:hypothetical protein